MPRPRGAQPRGERQEGSGKPGRKPTLSQPVAISVELFETMIHAKVIKPPVCPPFAKMDKWIKQERGVLEIHHDVDSGFEIATITAPGPDGPIEYEGEGITIEIAVCESIAVFFKERPKQAELTPAPVEKHSSRGRRSSEFEQVSMIDPQADDDGAAGDLEDQLDRALAADDDEPAGGFSTHSYDGDHLIETLNLDDADLWLLSRPTMVRQATWADLADDFSVFSPDAVGGVQARFDAGKRPPEETEYAPIGDQFWMIEYGFTYDPEAREIRVEGSGDLRWSFAAPSIGTVDEPAPAIVEPVENARKPLTGIAVADENLWTQHCPAMIDIVDQTNGAAEFWMAPGFVYVSSEGAIYDAIAQRVWTRSMPVLGTKDRPQIPSYVLEGKIGLSDELQRRTEVSWALSQAGIQTVYVDTDTLEYFTETPNIETGENDETVLETDQVETTYARALADGKIKFPAKAELPSLSPESTGGPDPEELADLIAAHEGDGEPEEGEPDSDEPESPAIDQDDLDGDLDSIVDPQGDEPEAAESDEPEPAEETIDEIRDDPDGPDEDEPRLVPDANGDFVPAEPAPAPEPPDIGCMAINAGSSRGDVPCGNHPAAQVGDLNVRLCPSHLGYVRKFGSIRILGGNILWFIDGQMILKAADDPLKVIAASPDAGLTRKNLSPADSIMAAAMGENGAGDPAADKLPYSPPAITDLSEGIETAEAIRKALEGYGVEFDGDRPIAPAKGRGRPNKNAKAIADLIALYDLQPKTERSSGVAFEEITS